VEATRRGGDDHRPIIGVGAALCIGSRRAPGIPVETTRVELGDLMATLDLSGTLIDDRTVTVTALLDGEITAIGVREGEVTKAGQELASLDEREPRALVDRARAELVRERLGLAAARASHERLERMAGDVSSQALADSRLALDSAEAAVDVAIASLRVPRGRHRGARVARDPPSRRRRRRRRAAVSRALDTLGQAARALGDNRLRTAPSVLGITIGIAAVMAVGAVSRGDNRLVFAELETFGLNSVWVYRDWNDEGSGRERRSGTGIDSADYRAIRRDADTLPLAALTPIVEGRWEDREIRRGNRRVDARSIGVDVDYPAIVNDRLVAGRSLNRHDVTERRAVALLAPDVAGALFEPGENTIGETIRLAGRRFTVVGLLGGKSRDFLSSIGSAGGQDANDRVIVPYTTQQRLRGVDEIDNLHLEVADFDEAETVATLVRGRLAARHPVGYAYAGETMAGYIRTTRRILGGVSLVGVIAASVSLLVGGMGIANMTGTSVLERTREIGARERDILARFLLEAVLISVGGVLGLLIGTLASVALAGLTGFPPLPSAASIVGALLVSMLVGVLSGYLPARRAARLEPVAALRSD